jgi:ubiquitin carboxyl-terminal hydrolase 8
MGAGCCGRTVEGDDRLMMLRKHRKRSGDEDEEASPQPQIDPGYLSLPNRFNRKSKREIEVGLGGLENMGNTCYINAALQCVLNCQPLVDYLISGTYEEEINPFNPLGSQGELTRAIADLTKVQWKDAFEVIMPKHLVELIREIAPIFAEGIQHDAHELLSFLLDQLHEDLNRATDRTPINKQVYTNESDEKQAAKAWAQHLKRNSSVIVDLFQGQLKSTLRCAQCSYQSVTFDTFMYLSLPIPKRLQRPSLQDCLAEFTREEKLEAGWICPVCDTQVEAFKKFDIWKVPPVLMFHLKRFHFNSQMKGKITKFVRYPISNFDLSEYITGPQKHPPSYDLFAKTDHEGSLSQGHYSAACRNMKNQKWYCFDDEHVAKLFPENLLTGTAYVLFYCKNSVQEYGRQAEDLPQLWPHFVSRQGSRKESLASEKPEEELSMQHLSHIGNRRKPTIETTLASLPSEM